MMGDMKKRLTTIKHNIRVEDIMSKKIISIDKNNHVYDAIKLMAERSISTIIITENNKPKGIVTERDLVKKILLKEKDPKKTKISEIMTEHPKTISPQAPILVAGNLMKTQKVRKLIVVNEKGEIVGLLSQTDIINSMNKIYENYRFMLGNPLFSFIFMAVIIILVVLSIILFKK